MNRWFFSILGLFAAVAFSAEEAAPSENKGGEKRLSVKLGLLRDGGSRSIQIPAQGDEAACEIFVDGRIKEARGGEPETPGEIYLREEFSKIGGKPLSFEASEKYLQRVEKALLAHYGAEKLLEIVLHPIEPGIHLTEEEFGKKSSEPKFNDRMDAQYLMQEIVEYRTSHGALKGKK